METTCLAASLLTTIILQDMELFLVRRLHMLDQSEWEPVLTVFKDQAIAMGSGTYNWTVPDVRYGGFVASPFNDSDASLATNTVLNSSYGLWLSGSESPGGGYGNRTSWFEIGSPTNSRFLRLDLGQIIGAVVVALAALILGTTAIEIMLRLTRNASEIRQLEAGEPSERDSFDLVSDEKVKAEYRYQIY